MLGKIFKPSFRIVTGVLAISVTRLIKNQLFLKCLKMPPLKERIRGEYENKIRRSSPPEKIFECFASISMAGSIFMSHSDLFAAIVPYNYSTTMD